MTARVSGLGRVLQNQKHPPSFFNQLVNSNYQKLNQSDIGFWLLVFRLKTINPMLNVGRAVRDQLLTTLL